MKRILFLADINSTHTRKWAVSLAEKGFTIGIFSLGKSNSDWWKEKNITVFSADINKKKFSSSSFSKVSFLKVIPQVKKIIKEFNPDILHSHYATSYGFIGARTHFHPFIISVWGSDVMDFPRRSIIHKMILKNNLKSADKILATSKTIEKYIHEIIKKEVTITPFGVDTEIFRPKKVKSFFNESDLVIGSIKQLEKIYCIDILLESFKNISLLYPSLPLKLLIVGSGSEEIKLKSIVKKSELDNKVIFTGWIENNLIPDYHNMIDIFVNISERESFGVSVLEASACEKAVIATNIDALSEIIIPDETGILVEPKNIKETVYAIEKLILDSGFRKQIGINARKRVVNFFDWEKILNNIIAIYKNT